MGIAKKIAHKAEAVKGSTHLFPSMPRPNLRVAQPVVRRFCASHQVPSVEASAFASYGAVIRHLHDVGAELRRARKIAAA